MTKISFVIPCYRSTDTLEHVVQSIIRTVQQREGLDYEIILVNDNPPDPTWDLIERLSAGNSRIHGICFTRNFGQHAALMAGYRNASGDIVVSLDDDGQNPPEEMFRLIDALDDRTDLVYAKYRQKKHSWFRNLGSRMNNSMICWLLNKPKDFYLGSYLAAKKIIIDEMVRCDNPFPYVDGLALRSTDSYRNVEVDHMERESGESGYSLGKLLGLWLNGLTAFSVKPLRFATFAGFLIALLGVVFALIIIIQKLVQGDSVLEGWPSLMTIVLILNGMMMMMLGLVGEYIGRIYVSMNKNPQYVIRSRTAGGEERQEDLSAL